MQTVTERFLRYVSFDTQSAHEQEQIPSTDKQKVLGALLVKEMLEMGIEDARKSGGSGHECRGGGSGPVSGN